MEGHEVTHLLLLHFISDIQYTRFFNIFCTDNHTPWVSEGLKSVLSPSVPSLNSTYLRNFVFAPIMQIYFNNLIIEA